LYLFLKDVDKVSAVSIKAHHCYQLNTHLMQNYSLNINKNAQRITGDNQCGLQHNIHSY